MSPEARWIPFTAEEFIDSTHSNFRWEAHLDAGKVGSPSVIDAYEGGHGRLVVKLAGVVPVKRITGPDADHGELQRYLSSIVFCPPMLLNHPTLELNEVGPSTLRLRDRQDPTRATVDVDVSADGCPTECHTIRPRMVGKRTILTPWSGVGGEFRDYDGLRIATQIKVTWQLPESLFTYFRAQLTSFRTVR